MEIESEICWGLFFDSKIDVKMFWGKMFVIEIETQILKAKVIEIEIEIEIWGASMFEIVIEMIFYISYFSYKFSSENGSFLHEKGLKMALNGLKNCKKGQKYGTKRVF